MLAVFRSRRFNYSTHYTIFQLSRLKHSFTLFSPTISRTRRRLCPRCHLPCHYKRRCYYHPTRHCPGHNSRVCGRSSHPNCRSCDNCYCSANWDKPGSLHLSRYNSRGLCNISNVHFHHNWIEISAKHSSGR